MVQGKSTDVAVAGKSDAVYGLAFGNHVAADPDRSGDPVLSSVFAGISDGGSFGGVFRRPADEGLGRAWLLQPGKKPEKNGGNRCFFLRGKFPSEAKELRKLPGIGDYTAGAVASIAFGQPEPAVDGNVLRVLTRVTACGEDILRDKTKKMFAGWLRWEYPSGSDAALLTEGLMELGEVVCIPNGVPKCAVCPLSAFCRAKLSGTVEKYPVKTPKKQRKAEEKTVFLLSYRGKYALCRRGEKGLLAGMWEFPNTEGCLSEKEAETFLRAKGAELLCCLPCGKAKHIFTHIEWLLTGYEAECREEINGFVWKTPEEIRRDYAIPSAFGYFFKRLPEM